MLGSERTNNIAGWGFDWKFMWDRAEELNIADAFGALGRVKSVGSELEKKELSSSALGDNIFYLMPMRGRVDIDLLKCVQNNPSFKLPSYKLDDVAAHFMRGDIVGSQILDAGCGDATRLVTKSTAGLVEGGYVKIVSHDGILEDTVLNGRKFVVTNIARDAFDVDAEVELTANVKYAWCEAKDDVTAKDIFRMQKEGPAERALVAKYCVQDCFLTLRLFNKLEVLANNMAMGNVCGVPFSYLFLRGQGVKVGYVIFVLRNLSCWTDDGFDVFLGLSRRSTPSSPDSVARTATRSPFSARRSRTRACPIRSSRSACAN